MAKKLHTDKKEYHTMKKSKAKLTQPTEAIQPVIQVPQNPLPIIRYATILHHTESNGLIEINVKRELVIECESKPFTNNPDVNMQFGVKSDNAESLCDCINEFANALDSANGKKNELRETIKEEDNEIENLKSEIETLKDNDREKEIENLKEQLKNYQQILNDVRKLNRELEEKLSAANKAIRNYQSFPSK